MAMGDFEHKVTYIVLILITWVVFGITLLMNALASIPGSSDIFHNTTGEIARAYNDEITPAGWAFSIWGAIYIWQAIWLLYGALLVCRMTSHSYMYVSPAQIPPVVYALFIFNNITNVGWLIVWDRFFPQYALILLILSSISLIAMIYLACWQLRLTADALISEGKYCDIWCTIIFLHNGLGLYAGWASVAAILNLEVVLAHVNLLDAAFSCIIALALIICASLAWLITEITTLDLYTRYIITPYMSLLVALSGSFDSIRPPDDTVGVLVTFAFGLAILLFVLKMAITIKRHLKYPIYNREHSILSFQPYNNLYGSVSKSYEKSLLP